MDKYDLVKEAIFNALSNAAGQAKNFAKRVGTSAYHGGGGVGAGLSAGLKSAQRGWGQMGLGGKLATGAGLAGAAGLAGLAGKSMYDSGKRLYDAGQDVMEGNYGEAAKKTIIPGIATLGLGMGAGALASGIRGSLSPGISSTVPPLRKSASVQNLLKRWRGSKKPLGKRLGRRLKV